MTSGKPDAIPAYINPDIQDIFPDTLTILTTYRCNAACEECCFESNPKVEGRLSLAEMEQQIDEAVESFKALQIIVFSGGEAFLLKDDLFKAIAKVTSHKKMSRVVSNGFWGVSQNQAKQTATKLKEAGLSELNISTGLDHQRWVPVESVIRAARATVEQGIFSLITVEKDSPDSNCFNRIANDPEVLMLKKEHSDLFELRSNSWMPFHETAQDRGELENKESLRSGCAQLFHNIVVTPHRQVSACCGLTLEHIPEMKLGNVGDRSLHAMYNEQFDDFMKIWLAVDGPYRIIERLTEPGERDSLDSVVHICQACALLHLHPEIRRRARSRFHEFVPEIISRFNLDQTLVKKEVSATQMGG